jgi:hypothetical protein|tara:strand:+ start:537 stop:701 length:165 start_codon:yes stop_codon:yes gene_type:complete
MAKYDSINSQRIKSRSGNPSPLVEGTMFYDTSSNTLKIVYNNSGTLTVVTVTPV